MQAFGTSAIIPTLLPRIGRGAGFGSILNGLRRYLRVWSVAGFTQASSTPGSIADDVFLIAWLPKESHSVRVRLSTSARTYAACQLSSWMSDFTRQLTLSRPLSLAPERFLPSSRARPDYASVPHQADSSDQDTVFEKEQEPVRRAI